MKRCLPQSLEKKHRMYTTFLKDVDDDTPTPCDSVDSEEYWPSCGIVRTPHKIDLVLARSNFTPKNLIDKFDLNICKISSRDCRYWPRPTESLTQSLSSKLGSPSLSVASFLVVPMSSCNLAGATKATRRSQRQSSRSYFIQTVDSKPPIRPYWIPEDGLGPNRTLHSFERKKTKTGWVGGKN